MRSSALFMNAEGRGHDGAIADGVGLGSLAVRPQSVLGGDVVMWLPVISDGFASPDGCLARRAHVSARSG